MKYASYYEFILCVSESLNRFLEIPSLSPSSYNSQIFFVYKSTNTRQQKEQLTVITLYSVVNC